jgi:hypothetical protein
MKKFLIVLAIILTGIAGNAQKKVSLPVPPPPPGLKTPPPPPGTKFVVVNPPGQPARHVYHRKYHRRKHRRVVHK